MPSPKPEQISDVPAIIVFGVISAILLGLAGWQPKEAAWIAKAIEAESSTTMVEATSGRSAAEPMRKPMQPTAWSQVINSRELVRGQ